MTGPRSQAHAPPRFSLYALVVVFFTIVLALIGAGGTALSRALPVQPIPAPLHLSWLVIALLFGVSQYFVLHVQIRREARSVFLSEIPFVLGLLSLSPVAFSVARFLGAIGANGVARRQFHQPLKLMFNLFLAGGEAGVGLVIYHLVAGGAGWGPRVWVAAVVAATVSSTFAAASVALVIQLVERGVDARALIRLLLTSCLEAAGISALGVVVATSLADNEWATIPLAFGGATLLAAYRAYASLSHRHLSLERLYRFSQVVTSTPEVDDILLRVLEQARELLHAEQARLTFLGPEPDERVEVVLGRTHGLRRGPAFYLTEETGWLLDRVLRDRQPVIVARGTKDPTARSWLERCGLRESIVVPLHGDAGVIAALAVDDRLGEARGFNVDDVHLLQTVANHAAIALRNGQLVDQLRHESMHDGLTALPNRAMFQRELAQRLHRTTDIVPFGVAILDLDSFKDINDTLGHQHGDDLLREVAQRLHSSAGNEALVARLGGDEFAILIDNCSDVTVAMRFGQRLLRALDAPVALSDVEVDVSGSLGVALAPVHGTSQSQLLKRADIAMYAAKTTGRGLQVFDSDMDTESPNKLAVVTRLRHGISSGALRIHLQPKIHLRSGRIVSAEALVRWSDPERGLVLPDQFVPLAERSGLIRPLTIAVLSAAIRVCARWQEEAPGVGVAVNLSARSLTDASLLGEVDRLLKREQLEAELLTLEITESSIMADPTSTLDLLHGLRVRGVRLSVDDFGTGYSSLSYLRRLPVSEVKIDQSFVRRMHEHRDDRAIVQSIIDLARSLQLETVAEGVEDQGTLALLRHMGCDLAQGYGIDRPMSEVEFRRMLKASLQVADARTG